MRRHLHHPGRRAFLQALAGALGTIPLALPRTTVAQAGPAATRLGERISLITGAGNNVLALAGQNESLLVDAGDAAHATNVKEILLKATGKVSTVINTHYHLESTGGNDAMAAAGAEIAAHLNTKLWMTQEIIRDWERGKVYPPRAKAALPTQTFRAASGEMTFAGERIEYGLLTQAHTDGDLFVHFPKLNLIAVGGVVSAEEWPLLDYRNGAWLGGRVRALERLADLVKPDTRVVPANGRLMTGSEIVRHRDMYQKLFTTMIGYLNMGLGPEDAVQRNPLKEHQSEFGYT
jgi:glyoxylase-like metal-dependent hydrolase (beta-lactamase superfamily II)